MEQLWNFLILACMSSLTRAETDCVDDNFHCSSLHVSQCSSPWMTQHCCHTCRSHNHHSGTTSPPPTTSTAQATTTACVDNDHHCARMSTIYCSSGHWMREHCCHTCRSLHHHHHHSASHTQHQSSSGSQTQHQSSSGSQTQQQTSSGGSQQQQQQQSGGNAVNGHWGVWSAWGHCSAACGYGRMSRSRKCDSPAPAHGGHYCHGNSTTSDECYIQACTTTHTSVSSVNGHWGAWSSWSQCSETCGYGHMSRSRKCDSPAPANGGHRCHGHDTARDQCYVRACMTAHTIVDGHWSTWSAWSSCSASCGNGTVTRNRQCNNPAPSGGGSVCHGHANQTRHCLLKECHDGVTCLSCQGSVFPHSCNKVEHCGPHSVCSVESYMSGGSILYNLGCKDAMFCQSNGIRSVEENSTSDFAYRTGVVTLCRECCTTSMCNAAGCGTPGYSTPRGPICYACDQRLTVDDCDTIQICGRDEFCSIEGHDFGSVHYYTTKCATTTMCTGNTPVALGRSVKDLDSEKEIARRRRRQVGTDPERKRRVGIAGDTHGHRQRDTDPRKDDIVVRQTQPACHQCCANDLCNRGVC